MVHWVAHKTMSGQHVNRPLNPQVTTLVKTRIPTRYGEFMLHYYGNNIDAKEHVALVHGEPRQAHAVPVRVHSECFTGDILGSRRCDCGEQLQQGLSLIGRAQCGVLIYLRQEGRGIGLMEKLKAYNLQDQGLDTVEANIHLGHLPDERDYRIATLILKDLGVNSIGLITNNPSKLNALVEHGIAVEDRIPIEIGLHSDNQDYLRTKAKKLDHLLSLEHESVSSKMKFLQPLLDLLSEYKDSSRTHHRPNLSPRPFVTLSYAQSIDGSISTGPNSHIPLSCQDSLEMTHVLRSRHQAILVGVNTVQVDDPQLNVRLVEGEDPTPVILDSTLRIPEGAKVLASSRNKPILITTTQSSNQQRQRLQAIGARVFEVAADPDGQVDLHAALALLKGQGCHTLMVEGGASVIKMFLAHHLVDYCIITLAPKLIGGLKAMEEISAAPSTPLSIVDCQYHRLGEDIIVSGRLDGS